MAPFVTCPTCPVYPPGVLQTVTIPDPTSLDGLGDLEITLIPSRGVTDINHFSEEGIQHFKEMLYEIDEEYRKRCVLKMEAIEVHLDRFDRLAKEVWDFNSGVVKRPDLWSWVNQEGPYDCSDCGWISHTDVPHFRDEYVAFVLHDIAEVLAMAEEDADYEEWLREVEVAVQNHNLNVVQCMDPEYRDGAGAFSSVTRFWKGLTGWCGEVVEHMGDSVDNMMEEWKKLGRCPTEIKQVRQGQIGHVLIKDRYKRLVQMKKGNFAETPLGDIWFPPKFERYLPEEGQYFWVSFTKNSGRNLADHRAPFTALYIH